MEAKTNLQLGCGSVSANAPRFWAGTLSLYPTPAACVVVASSLRNSKQSMPNPAWISERSRPAPAPRKRSSACTWHSPYSLASNLDEDVLQRGVDEAPGGDVERALGLLHGAEHLSDPHPLLGQLELVRSGDVVRPLGGGGDGPDQPLHRLVDVLARRRRHREHERAPVLRLQLGQETRNLLAVMFL